MKHKLDRRRQELRTKEAILYALQPGTDLGVIVVALAELVAEHARLLAKGREVALGAPDPLLLQDANVLLSRANLLMMTVARGVAWDSEWEKQASDWGSQFAGWEVRYARRGRVRVAREAGREMLYDETVTDVNESASWPDGLVRYEVKLAGYGDLWFPVKEPCQRPRVGDAVVAHVPADYGVVYVVTGRTGEGAR